MQAAAISIASPAASPAVIPLLVQQHADEAAIATLRRAALWQAEGATMADLRALDLQLEAHLHGLRHAGATGWRMAQAQAEEAPEALTALAFLACAEDLQPRLAALAALIRTDGAEAVAAGFCWHGPGYAAGLLPWLSGAGPVWGPVIAALRQMLGHHAPPQDRGLAAALARPMADWAAAPADPAAGWAGAAAQVPALATLLDDPAQAPTAAEALRRILGQPPEALLPLPDRAPLPDPYGTPPPPPPAALSHRLATWWQAQPGWPPDARLVLGGPASPARLRRKAASGFLRDYPWLCALARHDHGITDMAPPSAPYPLISKVFSPPTTQGDRS